MGIVKFAKALKETLNQKNVLTENGAVGYRTSGSPLVDFSFHTASFRNMDEMDIVKEFADAFDYHPSYAVKMLFFSGDVRQGMGERKVFNSCLQWLAQFHPDYCDAVVSLIAEYTRWDYLIALLGTKCDNCAWQVIKEQLDKDIPRTEIFDIIATHIDREIHRNYRLFPDNYAAWDLLEGNDLHHQHYTDEQQRQFEAYLAGQLERVTLENPDWDFLRRCLLTMYANPAINHTKALS